MELCDIIGPCVLTIIFSILLSYYLFSSIFPNSKSRTKTAPPPARGAWPFLGHLPVIANAPPDNLPYITFSAMADKHGPIFSIRLGSKPAVVVSSWQLAKELFTMHDVAVSSRPRFMAAELLGYNMAMFGFSPYSRYWRELRKLISVELLSSRRIDIQKHILVSETVQSIKELLKLWSREKDQSGRALVDMKEWFGCLNLNVVLRMVVGKRYFGSSGNSDEARQSRKVMRDFFHLGGVFTLGDAFPNLKWLDIGGYGKKMKETSKELDSLAEKWLEEHRDNGRYKTEGKQQDFMDVMLALMQNAKLQSEYDDDTIIKSTCSNLLSGASDTITIMLVWSLSLLSNHPKVLKKAQQELDQHVGKERTVNELDVTNLAYLQAIVKETLRLYPAAPVFVREFTQDCDVGGYHVAKGTWLLVNLWKLQRDPNIWTDQPTEFRPERFLGAPKDQGVNGVDFQWIPFGSGRRICPGVNFGLKMMHLVLAKLLQAFDFWTPYGEPVDMAGSVGLTNSKATPLEVLVAPRLSHTLY